MIGEFIDDFLEKNDMVDVVSDYVPDLKKISGGVYKGKCPFHDEKSGSFFIYKKNKKQYFKCHGCGEYGDLVNFLKKITGDSVAKIINYNKMENKQEKVIKVFNIDNIANVNSCVLRDYFCTVFEKDIVDLVFLKYGVYKEGDYTCFPACWEYMVSFVNKIKYAKNGKRIKEDFGALLEYFTDENGKGYKGGVFGLQLLNGVYSNIFIVESPKTAMYMSMYESSNKFPTNVWLSSCGGERFNVDMEEFIYRNSSKNAEILAVPDANFYSKWAKTAVYVNVKENVYNLFGKLLASGDVMDYMLLANDKAKAYMSIVTYTSDTLFTINNISEPILKKEYPIPLINIDDNSSFEEIYIDDSLVLKSNSIINDIFNKYYNIEWVMIVKEIHLIFSETSDKKETKEITDYCVSLKKQGSISINDIIRPYAVSCVKYSELYRAFPSYLSKGVEHCYQYLFHPVVLAYFLCKELNILTEGINDDINQDIKNILIYKKHG